MGIKYVCDNCKKSFDFDDNCFLGSLVGDESYSPFLTLDCLCSECYAEEIKSEDEKIQE